MPDIDGDFQTFNPSGTRLSLTNADAGILYSTRVSNSHYCGALTYRPKNRTSFALLALGPRSWRVALSEDDASALHDYKGFEDLRPLELAPRVIALVGTIVRRRDLHNGHPVPRMCVAIVYLGEHSPSVSGGAEDVITPRAVVLLGEHNGVPQKNWMPFLSGDCLWLVKGVAPQSSVTVQRERLLAARGVSTVALDELGPDERALLLAGAKRFPWRGSSQLIRAADFFRSESMGLLSLIHRRLTNGRKTPLEYETAFATFDENPPHRLMAVSRAFRFHVQPDVYGYPRHPKEHRSFTYASGMLLSRGPSLRCSSLCDLSCVGGASLSVSYATQLFGIDDCGAFSVDITESVVVDLFAQGVNAPVLELPWVALINSSSLVDDDSALVRSSVQVTTPETATGSESRNRCSRNV